ncbi:MAG: hypothetical protein MJ231_08245 [bacterium]|nr:hypothetical protein [bacterium]
MSEIQEEIKMLAAQKGLTLSHIANYLSRYYGRKYTLDSLSKKLRANTIKYSEMKLIAEALKMEVVIKDKEET